ncbi:transcription antitermination factor NusB [Balneolales bacterium ANBcel1]|nr:transcription antitermination factor NusB [Balneolales bacterium ANBcel1]
MSNRRKIRETVLQAIYSSIIGDHSPEHVLQTIVKPNLSQDTAGLAFAEKLYLRSLDNRSDVEEIISKHIANWEIERLATVDRFILQMAITELLTFEDIPTKVTINEAIEIAKEYSTAKSGRFVNGILDAALISLQQEGKLKKKGRGLIDAPARRPHAGPVDYGQDEDFPEDASQQEPIDPDRPAATKKKRIKRPKRSP